MEKMTEVEKMTYMTTTTTAMTTASTSHVVMAEVYSRPYTKSAEQMGE